MKFVKQLLSGLLLFVAMIPVLASTSSFVISHIQVKGLHRVSRKTVLSYLPVKIGDRYQSTDGNKIIRKLYATGFFSRVRLQRLGDTLIIRVTERPVIGLIHITGNDEIPKKKLKPVLEHMDIVVGNVYDSSKVAALAKGLEQEYDRLGYHSTTVDVDAKKGKRGSVALYIQVHEGKIIKVRRIRIIGNHHFSESELREQFQLTTPGIMTIFNHHDRYSKTQLTIDLGHLKKFYQNHGYLRYRLVKRDVVFSKDRGSAYITITIDEGPQYHLHGYRVVGRFAHDDKLNALIDLTPGMVFSRKKIVDVNTQIQHYFADKGYAFPQIHAVPTVNDTQHTVFLTYHITRGPKVYVRQIHFSGNLHTEDKVLRSQVLQMEGGLYSLKKIKESKRRLANLRYLRNIKVKTKPVPGHPDEVDLIYSVKEVKAGKASLNGGYSDVDGFMYGVSVSEPNFAGTGKFVSVGFRNSQYSDNYHFTYVNPFYTVNNISRSISVFYHHTTPNEDFDLEPYTMDDFGVSVGYGIPITLYNSIHLGFGYDHISISNINRNTSAPSIVDFIDQHPSPYDQLNLNASWTHSTLDRAVFPTTGGQQTLSTVIGVPISDSTSLGYYKIDFTMKWYYPIGWGFIINPHAHIGYGDGFDNTDSLPFFYHYYAGGITSLPGYAPNSLGPRNPISGTGNPALGGNLLILGGVNLILPNFIDDSLRIAAILDVGNVFSTHHVKSPAGVAQTQYESVSLKNLRFTAGVMVSWYSPFGPIEVSIATPLNKKAGDDARLIGFTFGASL